jgi:hypothetical protein
MPPVKSASEIAQKWARVTPTRDADYRSGVSDPAVRWQAPTAAAAANYNEGVQAAIAANAFSRGVNAAGDEAWRAKTVEVGTGRWGPGVRAAQADYEAGLTPFRDVIERTQLPPRAPAGDPRNLERSAAMARALHEAKQRQA